MAILFWLTRPRMLLHRLQYWFWERRNPDKPWMCPGTIMFCEGRLNRQMRGLEFGSGRSTAWFAARLGHLTSIEHHAGWFAEVGRRLAADNIPNVDYRCIALNHPETEPERGEYAPTPDYVLVLDEFPDGSLDIVIVDGHYRTTCVRNALRTVSPGGYLLVDDVNMWKSIDVLPVPKEWAVVDDSTNGVKRCVVWQRPRR